MIVPVYEAKTLFANIDQIVTAAFTFMMDLDRATPDTVAEVCLKHVRGNQYKRLLTIAIFWDIRPI
jgi:hypothetical protein